MVSRIFLDTNIFLELEFQNRRWQECKQLLKKVDAGEVRASTSDFVVYGSVLEIESKERVETSSKIEIFLAVISSLKRLSILRPTIAEMADAAKLMEKETRLR